MQIVIPSSYCNLIKPFQFWSVFLLEFGDNPLPRWQDRFIISGSSDRCHVSSDNESVTSLGSLFNDLVTVIFSSGRDAKCTLLQLEVLPLVRSLRINEINCFLSNQ